MQSLWSGLPSIYLLCAAGALQMDECRPNGNLYLAAHTVLLLLGWIFVFYNIVLFKHIVVLYIVQMIKDFFKNFTLC